MNKSALIRELSRHGGLTRPEAKRIVELFFEEMAAALARGERVEIRGLWSLYVKKYNGYRGRNPRSGETIKVSSKKLPFFKCSKELRERVDTYRS